MADVFLSYARGNLAEARRLAAHLKSCGFSLWFDESLPAHRPFCDVIEEQLEAARAVAVLWSREAVGSQWVRSEANHGRERGRLVQVRLDDARLPMPFDQVQCADLGDWDGDPDDPAWRSVLASIAELTGQKPADGAVRSSTSNMPKSGKQRRQLLISGGAAVAVAAGGFAGWRYFDRPKVSPQAQLLIQKGMDALQQNDALDSQDPGSTLTAIAFLTEATSTAPESATAWGGLALAYAVRQRVVPLSERPGLVSRSRAAAKTALELDPAEAVAMGALRMLDPPYRNWIAAERGDREALTKSPRMPLLLFILSDLLGHVGRWNEATQYSNMLDRRKFLIPGADRKVVINHWASDDLQAADRALDIAVTQWPQHPQIFRVRIAYLMYSGRPVEALEIMRREADWPNEIKQDFVAAVRATAEALAGQRRPPDAVKAALDYLDDNPQSALQVAHACVALGDAPTAYSLFNGYYFGDGEWSKLAPIGGDQDRVTSPLFLPMMRGIWRQRSFNQLLERIGLNAYWRQSGTTPDFRT